MSGLCIIIIIIKHILSFECSYRSEGFIKNLTVQNLDKFVVTNINSNIFRLRVDFDVKFPELIAHGDYYFDSTIPQFGNDSQLWGEGPFWISLHGTF